MTEPAGETSPDRLSIWESYTQLAIAVEAQLASSLDAAGLVSLGSYQVLRGLGQAGGSLRSRELLEVVVLSQPGLSRRLDRLAADGLVERRPDPQDGRGVIVRITRAGRSALRAAAKVYAQIIEREFGGRLTDSDADRLIGILRRLSGPVAV